jgi:Domain of unknown function (DUF5130)
MRPSCGLPPTKLSATRTAGMVRQSSQLGVAPVARGEVATIEPTELPKGSVITTSGRISGVTEPGDVSVHYPFPIKDLVAIDDALKYASRSSMARFAIYLGDLGSDTAARAREILAKVPTPNDAVLLAVSPGQRAIEVVYGSQVRGRGAESAAPLGVAAAASAFGQGHLVDGLVSAVRVLSAGISPA